MGLFEDKSIIRLACNGICRDTTCYDLDTKPNPKKSCIEAFWSQVGRSNLGEMHAPILSMNHLLMDHH